MHRAEPPGELTQMSSMINRRKFLTHSAATVGGVAMAGSVVDGMLANVANAAAGVGTGTPVRGGTLTVGLASDIPAALTFNGSHSKWDAGAFARGAAIYDTLVMIKKTGDDVLPCLATKWSSSNNYKSWKFTLRTGVTFHDGTAFSADDVVANMQASMSDGTVGPAIIPIFASSNYCVNNGDGTVTFNLAFPLVNFPMWIADAQIGRMASGKNWDNAGVTAGTTTLALQNAKTEAPLSLAYNGLSQACPGPVGTGPFKFVSWSQMNTFVTTAFANYWKKDAKGRDLPFLDGVTFKVIVDPTDRNNALASGNIDVLYTTDGTSIASIKAGNISNVGWRTDTGDKRDPATNSIILNSTGTLNQWGMWYTGKDFSGTNSYGIPGIYPYLKKNGTIQALLGNGLTLTQINQLYALYASAGKAAVATAAGGGDTGTLVSNYIAASALPAFYPAGVDLGADSARCMPPVSVQNNLYGWVNGQPGNWLIDPNNNYTKPATFVNINGAMSDDGTQWVPGKFNPLTSLDFRKACAAAINRATYLKVVDSNVGVKSDGPFKPSSRFYNSNNGYPAFDGSKLKTVAKGHLNDYKAANPGKNTSFTLQYVENSNAATQAFTFISKALQDVGITVVAKPVNQVLLIGNVVNGTYDASSWSQFGGVDPSENYVWWNSQNLKDELYFWSLDNSYKIGGANAKNIAGAVNFAHQADPRLQSAMLAACAAPVPDDTVNYWKQVAGYFGQNVNYLWLDATITMWAASSSVQNWAFENDGGTPGTKIIKGVTTPYLSYGAVMSPNGGENHWDQVWKTA